MKRFAIAAAKGERTDPLWIKRLPAHRKFRFLCVILRVLRRDRWQACDGQNCRGVLAVPFLALGNIELEAVRTGKVPQRAGHWKSHFLIGRPDVPVHSGRFEIGSALRAKGGAQCVGIVLPPLATVFESAAKETGPAGRLNRSPLRVR